MGREVGLYVREEIGEPVEVAFVIHKVKKKS